MGSFVRRVRTASGATAVQIVHKRGRIVLGIDHIGSAHDEGQLAMLLETARARLNAGQQMLPIEDGPTGGRPIGEPVVEDTASLIVWETLEAIYASLGLDRIGDNAFKALVWPGSSSRPASKTPAGCWPKPGCGPVVSDGEAAAARLCEAGLAEPAVRACAAAAQLGPSALVLYDVTVRHEALLLERG